MPRSSTCSKSKKKLQFPSNYTQINFQLRELEQTYTKAPEKFVYYVEADLGNGVYFHTYVAASDKEEAITLAKLRLPNIGEAYCVWSARKKH